jgi:hypothetical protein
MEVHSGHARVRRILRRILRWRCAGSAPDLRRIRPTGPAAILVILVGAPRITMVFPIDFKLLSLVDPRAETASQPLGECVTHRAASAG